MNLDVAENENFDGTKRGEEPVAEAKPVVEEQKQEQEPAQEQPKAVVAAVAQLPQTRQPQAPIEADERGLFRGATLETEWRIATAYSQSGLMPAALNTPAKVLVALQLCRELGLPPVSSISRIMVLNGSPSLFGDLPLAIVRKSGFLGSIKETWTKNEAGEITGATCTVVRKDTGETVERSFTADDAKLAQLWNKKSSSGKPTPWVLYPSRMMQMRSRSWALKDAFADVLSGVQIAEYDNNATVENGQLVGAEAGLSLADKLNDAHFEVS